MSSMYDHYICFFFFFLPISQNRHTHTQTIRRQIAEKLFECV